MPKPKLHTVPVSNRKYGPNGTSKVARAGFEIEKSVIAGLPIENKAIAAKHNLAAATVPVIIRIIKRHHGIIASRVIGRPLEPKIRHIFAQEVKKEKVKIMDVLCRVWKEAGCIYPSESTVRSVLRSMNRSIMFDYTGVNRYMLAESNEERIKVLREYKYRNTGK